VDGFGVDVAFGQLRQLLIGFGLMPRIRRLILGAKRTLAAHIRQPAKAAWPHHPAAAVDCATGAIDYAGRNYLSATQESLKV
jgi:hypothetical protein